MTIASIHQLNEPVQKPRKPTRKAAKARPVTVRMVRRLKLRHGVAIVIGFIAAAMTTVSLSHIAGGIETLTHGAVPGWQSWMVSLQYVPIIIDHSHSA